MRIENGDRRKKTCLVGRFYRQADAIVAVFQGVADDLSATAGLARKRIATIYNPVVRPGLAALAAAPAPHPWLEDGGPPVIVAAAALSAAIGRALDAPPPWHRLNVTA